MIVYPVNFRIGDNTITFAVVTDENVAHDLCYQFCKSILKTESKILKQHRSYYDNSDLSNYAIAWFQEIELNNISEAQDEIAIYNSYK